jgi:hypothetical protein
MSRDSGREKMKSNVKESTAVVRQLQNKAYTRINVIVIRVVVFICETFVIVIKE